MEPEACYFPNKILEDGESQKSGGTEPVKHRFRNNIVRCERYRDIMHIIHSVTDINSS